MNTKQDWSMSILASDDRRGKLRGPVLAGVIAGLHAAAIAGFLMIQGCGTKQPAVEPPPAPVMPPRADIDVPPPVMPRPSFQPPVGVEPAPTTVESVQTHTVAAGESLSRIAARYGVSTRELQELNAIKDPNKIRIGQKLKLPAYAESAPAAAAAPAAPPKKEAKPAKKAVGEGEYVVQSGDSLSRIAARHGTTVAALKEANNLKSDVIRIGQKLKIPAGAAKPAAARAPAPVPTAAEAPAPAAPPTGEASPAPVAAPAAVPTPITPLDASSLPFEYTVRPNETLDDIARNFAVTRAEILALNGLSEGAEVRAGQKIKIPMAAP
jgi:peptidoglycan endopeptidase LytE